MLSKLLTRDSSKASFHSVNLTFIMDLTSRLEFNGGLVKIKATAYLGEHIHFMCRPADAILSVFKINQSVYSDMGIQKITFETVGNLCRYVCIGWDKCKIWRLP